MGILQLTGAFSLKWVYSKQLIPVWQSGVSGCNFLHQTGLYGYLNIYIITIDVI